MCGLARGLIALGIAEMLLAAVGFMMIGRFVVLLVVFSLVLTLWLVNSGWRVMLELYRCKRASPNEYPTLHLALEDVCTRAGVPKPEMYIMDTPTPNAMAVGRGAGCAGICLSEALMQLLDEDELKAVLAHEIAHIKNRDVVFSSAAAITGILLAHLGYASLYSSATEESSILHMVVGGMLIPLAYLVVLCGYSRACEFRADMLAATLTSKDALRRALLKTEANARRVYINPASAHLFFSPPMLPESLRKMFSLHPSTEERVRAL